MHVVSWLGAGKAEKNLRVGIILSKNLIGKGLGKQTSFF